MAGEQHRHDISDRAWEKIKPHTIGEKGALVRMLESLGRRAHDESRAGFPNMRKLLEERGAEE